LDVKERFSEEQIIGFLKEADSSVPVKELARKYGFSDASFYLWRSEGTLAHFLDWIEQPRSRSLLGKLVVWVV
jgi:predicted DNA-binding transcriptional regulator AlpA